MRRGGSRSRPRTSARAVPRFTDASSTPGTAARAFSIVVTQEAQCIPWMASVTAGASGLVARPASRGDRLGGGGGAGGPTVGSTGIVPLRIGESGGRRATPQAYRGVAENEDRSARAAV